MSKNKTLPTDVNVMEYLNSIEPVKRRKEGQILNQVFEKATGEKAKMWGPSIIGFGTYHYKYKS